MPEVKERPPFVIDEHLEYLDNLRESGVTNMYGARPYVANAFPDLSGDESKEILVYWMASFLERHPHPSG